MAETTPTTMRVRSILKGLDLANRNELKKCLPKGCKMPDGLTTARYPSALLGVLNKGEEYALLGCIAEDMLRFEKENICWSNLKKIILKHQPSMEEGLIAKVEKSKTTEPFLEVLRVTREKMDEIVRGELQGETQIIRDLVEGHPDARTVDQLFEIKLTGMLKDNWTDFMLQLFAYGSIDTGVKDLYLVLPLQQTVLRYNLKDWTKRDDYHKVLNTNVAKMQKSSAMDMLVGTFIRMKFKIGTHMPKLKSLKDTFEKLGDPSAPYQVFLSAPHNTRMSITDLELGVGAGVIAKYGYQVYVHSQYIINLCTEGAGDDWNTDLLAKNLQYANALGCKGVVVHVGKSTSRPVPRAIESMRKNIMKVLEYATVECPLLLETPAGQGTETLTKDNDFMDFVESFEDKRLRACVDTCHIFACGHKPLEFLEKIKKREGMVKLIHYNDSATPCGSCVDRHAFMGTGHIGMEGMKKIAETCGEVGWPMVIE
jgi:endonuclease IV